MSHILSYVIFFFHFFFHLLAGTVTSQADMSLAPSRFGFFSSASYFEAKVMMIVKSCVCVCVCVFVCVCVLKKGDDDCYVY